ncbi:MAG: hypothetical protein WCY58_01990 [Mariniphaga sp.]|nr:hypothetical protein [Mariniphaga sp.]MDD4425428.1 hypothetical protein [Mariniphaga sp.]
MRNLILSVVLIIILSYHTQAQQKSNGIEINFSLIHPSRHGLSDYKYSADPAAEVLYFTSVTSRLSVAGGLMAQIGEHNWKELTGYTFTGEDGMPYRLRTDYSRRLSFFSLGVPVKLEWICRNSFFHSFFTGFTGGKHLELSLADYLDSAHIADLETNYNRFFWEINLGFRKNLYQTRGVTFTLSPKAGYRKNSPDKSIGEDNYIFYGLGVSAILTATGSTASGRANNPFHRRKSGIAPVRLASSDISR